MSYLYFFTCFLISPIFSAFFSSSETALANTTKVDGAVSELKSDEQGTLLTILFGNHWSNQLPTMALSAWSVTLFGVWFWLIMGAHTFYTLFLGEMLPKAYALINSNKVSSLLSPFLLPMVKIIGPFLSRFAPKREKTKAEICLEERLEAEKEAEVLTLSSLLEIYKDETPRLSDDDVSLIRMQDNVTLADAEEHCMKLLNNGYKPWKQIPNTWIQVTGSNEIGDKDTKGYLCLSMFHMKDWDHT
jgi:CBS domain containing-hemolysin-like protein